MSKSSIANPKVATPDHDTAALTKQKKFELLRKQAAARLLKRRRRKSGQ